MNSTYRQGFADLWRNLWLLIASMLLAPFRPRASHIVSFGPILPDRSSPEGAQEVLSDLT